MKQKKVLFITHSAMIAALYVILTYLASALGLSNGMIQVRFSEALTILPYFTPAAVPGVFIGCLISNILTGACLWDIIFGSITTLVAAIISYKIRKFKYAVCIPPIILNTLIIPWVLRYGYGMTDEAIPFMMLTVGIGEVISCGILGCILLSALYKYRNVLFKNS